MSSPTRRRRPEEVLGIESVWAAEDNPLAGIRHEKSASREASGPAAALVPGTRVVAESGAWASPRGVLQDARVKAEGILGTHRGGIATLPRPATEVTPPG